MMKTTANTLLAILLCAALAFGAVLPAFAAGQPEAEPTWQNTIESVTPVGDGPYVKLELSAEGYKIAECRLPRQYDIVFTDGTSASVRIADEPSHFVPLMSYETYFDVETPEGAITLYAGVYVSQTDPEAAYFSVGEYILRGSVGEDGLPAAGSEVYMFAIYGESFEAEVDEGSFLTRVLYFFYSAWQKIESWFVYHFGKLFSK